MNPGGARISLKLKYEIALRTLNHHRHTFTKLPEGLSKERAIERIKRLEEVVKNYQRLLVNKDE